MKRNKKTKKKLIGKKILKGIVVSDKMDKTIIVAVKTIKQHPYYKRRYKLIKKYKAHDQDNKYKTGDNVQIEESRPFSKDKTWLVFEPNNKKEEKIKESQK